MGSLRPALIGALSILALAASSPADPRAPAEGASVLDFTLDRIDGTPQSLGAYRGQVLLLVNVASQCGFTPQYAGLEKLHAHYRERGFAVLGFPSNDFGDQEPGTNEEIADFCRSKYGIQFPMFAKIRVKGDDAHPLYRHLTRLPEPVGGAVQWNFQKFLVDRQGRVVAKYPSRVTPDDPELVAKIEMLLDEDA